MRSGGGRQRPRDGHWIATALVAGVWAAAAATGCGGGSDDHGRPFLDARCGGLPCGDSGPGRSDAGPDGAGDAGGGADGTDAGPSGAVSCAVLSPAGGALVGGVVTVRATCEHPAGVREVRFAAGEEVFAQRAGAAPGTVYDADLDTAGLPDGALTLAVGAVSEDGARGSAAVTVTLDNTPPVVTLHEPAADGRFVGALAVAVTAVDANGVDRLLFTLDGAPLATVEEPPDGERYEATLDVAALTTGAYRLEAVALDPAGNRGAAGVDVRIVSAPRFRGEPARPIGSQRGAVTELAVGDADGDGTPDLWFAGSTHVGVRRGQGDGAFDPLEPLVEATTRTMLADDLDGDGRAELVLTEQTAEGPRVSIARFSAEDDAWRLDESHALAAPGTALALGDVDGDGRRDLLVGADPDENSIGVLRAREGGPPFFEGPVLYSGGVADVSQLAPADFDGDGDLDVVVGRDADIFSVFPGEGDGSFGIARNLRLPDRARGAAPIDLREDGVPDLVVTDWSGAAHVFLGEPADPEPWQFGDDERPYPPPRLPLGSHEVLVADLDDDGHEDFVVVNETSKNAAVFLGDGQGGARLDLLYNVGPFPGRAHLADLDGDGREDLVVLNRNVDQYTVALGRDGGRFGAPPELLVTFQDVAEPVDLVVADFDGTAAGGGERLDLMVVGAADSVSDDQYPLWLFRSDGRYPVVPGEQLLVDSPAEQGSLRDARTGDIDGDGAADLAVVFDAHDAATLGFLLGDGAGGFPQRVPLALGDRPRTLALCDVTGEGRPDVIVGAPGGALEQPPLLTVAEVLLGPPIGLAPLGAAELTGDVVDLQCARVDEDDANDFLTVNTTDGDLNYLRGTASVPVTQGERQALAVGEAPRRLAVADVDGDGEEDATASVEDNLALAFGAPGGRTFETSSFLSHPGRGPHGVAVRDFTDDGFPDIAVGNSADGTLSVYVNAGDRTFLGPVDYHTSREPTEVVAGDFNADGCADLAVLNATGRTVTLLLAEGARCRAEDQ